MEYRKHLQAFIDRWRYNANRGAIVQLILMLGVTDAGPRCYIAAQAQSRIKILEKVASHPRFSGTDDQC